MYKILIIEDEVSARKHLEKLLENSGISYELLATLATVSQSVKWFKANPQPDLVLMDIHLSDGISFDILTEVNIDCPIIYITAYDQYAIKAFKTTGIDYLLKPITQEDLNAGLRKFKSTRKPVNEELLLKSLEALNLIKKEKKPAYRARFLLKSGTQMVPVKSKQIAYFYRKDEVVFARVFEGKSYLLDQSLNYLQQQMDPTSFFRVSRQLLVNLDAIQGMNTFKPGQLSLKLLPEYHETVNLSQERSSRLKAILGEG